MSPLLSTFVGYPVSPEAIKQYREQHNLPEYNNRLLLRDIESKLGVPLTLVRVERDDTADSDYYFCCFADYSGRQDNTEALNAIPVSPAFLRLHQLVPVAGDVQRMFAPRTMNRESQE
jgi:hypothetical protein